ncbi:hypothetical protein BHE74_00033921 [Ensete ventricosum]|nr:hypothetical protein BHE74_00033921 [Ensete ventricosum]
MSLYSDSNEISVPESLIFFIVYHTATSHHIVRGSCDETRTLTFALTGSDRHRNEKKKMKGKEGGMINLSPPSTRDLIGVVGVGL